MTTESEIVGPSVEMVERFASDLADLRSRNEKLEQEVALLREASSQGLRGYVGSDEQRAGPRSRREWRQGRAGTAVGDVEVVDGPVGDASVSRRRMFALLGGAAAAGAGLAVAGTAMSPDPAGATTGAMQFGASQDAGTVTTVLTSAATTQIGGTFQAINTASSGAAISAAAGSGGVGVYATNTSSTNPTVSAQNLGTARALQVTGNTATSAMNITPSASLAGRPAGGAAGDFFVDQSGHLWFCNQTAGPAWISLSHGGNSFVLGAPVRVYDSRPGQPNQMENVQGALTFTAPPPTAQSRVIDCSRDASTGDPVAYQLVPQSLLLNLTIVSQSGVGALSVYSSTAAQPSVSNINWTAGGQILANSVTSATPNLAQLAVAIVAGAGASTHFIIDVIGYGRNPEIG